MKNSASDSKSRKSPFFSLGRGRSLLLASLAWGLGLSLLHADWEIVPPNSLWAWHGAGTGIYDYDPASNLSSYWANGVINNTFYENLNGYSTNLTYGFDELIYLNNGTTTYDPSSSLSFTANSFYGTNYWALLGSATATGNTLTLNGNIYARSLYGDAAASTTAAGQIASAVYIGYASVGSTVATYMLPINLNGATRTFYSELLSQALGTANGKDGSGLFIDNAITDTVGGIPGTDGINKTGYGAVILGGDNTFTGAVNVQAGTLELANQGSLASSTVILGGGTELIMGDNFSMGYAAPTGGVGAVALTMAWNGTTGTSGPTGSEVTGLTGDGNRLDVNGTVDLQGALIMSAAGAGRDVSTTATTGSDTFVVSSAGSIAVGDLIGVATGNAVPTIDGTVTGISGTTITLNNTVSIPASSNITFAEVQTLGTVNLQNGYNIFQPQSSGVTGSNYYNSAVINIATLNRTAGTTVDFEVNTPQNAGTTTGTFGTNYGLPYNEADVTFTNAPAMIGGIIPWANVSYNTGYAFDNSSNVPNGFATLAQGSELGTTVWYVVPLPSGDYTIYSATNSMSGAASTNAVPINAETASVYTQTIASATEINSLFTTVGTLTLTGSGTLQIDSGAIMINAGFVDNGVTLSFNNQEAIIQGSGSTAAITINANITNASDLVISGETGVEWNVLNQPVGLATLESVGITLGGVGSWTGGTYIDSNRLIIGAGNTAAIPTTSDVFIGSTGVVGQSYTDAGVLDLNNNSITIGALSGSGLVDFASVTATAWVVGNDVDTLTIGNSSDSGTFSGSILNTLSTYLPYLGNSVTGSIVKTGTGTETFSGLNLYEGTTSIDEGTLAVSGTGTLGIESDVTIGSGATLDISGALVAITGASGATVSLGSLAGAGTVNLGANYLSTSGDDSYTSFTGAIDGSGGGIVKNGYGTLTLALNGTGNTDWTTEIDSGTLLLDHSGSSGADLGPDLGTGLILGGGSLQIQGDATSGTTETAGGLTVNAGGSTIGIADSGNTATLALGAITRAAGGTVDFNAYTGGIITTTMTNTNGILGGWATVNGETDWAQSGSSGTNAITAYTGYSDAGTAGNWISTNNLSDLSAAYNFTAGAATSVNSLRINNGSGAGNINLTGYGLTVGSGGILETANVGANNFNISGGSLTTGTSQDLIFIQNDTLGALSVSSAIGGAGGLTKSGAGTVILSGNETYTGGTTVNDGDLVLTGGATLGAGTSQLTVANGAVADLSGTGATAQAASSIAGSGLIVLNTGGLTVGSASDTGSTVDTFSGQMSGAGGFTKTGLGTLILNGAQSTDGLGAPSIAANNSYTGATKINQGTVEIVGLGTLGHNSAVTITGTINGSTTLANESFASGATTITVASATGLAVGDTITGAGIPFGDIISAISGTTITLTNATTGVGTDVTLTDVPNETFAPATLDLSRADNQISLGSLAGTGTIILDPFGLSIGGNNTSTSFSGTFVGTGGIIKTGSGIFTYSGATAPLTSPTDLAGGWTIDQGTIDFDYSTNAATKITNGTTQTTTLGGGTLEMNGNATTAVTETDYKTLFAAGASSIVLDGNGAAMTLKLGAVTRSTGSTVDFNTVENSGATGALAIDYALATTNGILGGWATFNNESGWATDTGANTAIIAYTGYTDADTGAWSTANNLSDTSGVYNETLTAATSVNSLRINNGTGAGSINTGTFALTLTSGGLLETSSVGANNFTISGAGALVSGTTDLIIIQNNTQGTMDITAAIGKTGSAGFALTKSGAGTLILDNTNVYTYGTYVDAGTLQLGNTDVTATLGGGALYVAAGATADLSRVTSVTLANSAIPPSGATTLPALSGAGNVITPSGSLNVNLTGISNFSGVISGTGSLNKSGSGTLILSGANTYTGGTTISQNALLLNGGSLNSAVSFNGNTVFGGIGTVNGAVNVGGSQSPLLYVGIPGSANAGVQAVGTLTSGALTLSSNATIDFVLGSSAQAGTTYSTYIVNGALSLANSTLQLTTLDGFQAGTYQLFSDTSETGTFSSVYLNDSSSALDPSLYQISYNGDYVDLTIDSLAVGTLAVPEPGTWALLGIGSLFLALRARSARRGFKGGTMA